MVTSTGFLNFSYIGFLNFLKMKNFTLLGLFRLVAIWVVLLSLVCHTGFAQIPDWKWQNPLPQGNDLRGIHGLGGSRFIAVGSYGTILINSPSGGRPVIVASGTKRNLNSVCFADSLNGWAVGDSGTILYSSNGGHSWLSQNSGSTYNLNKVFFLNSLVGWVAGDHGTILKTLNGGQSWQTYATSTLNNVLSVHFINEQVGLAGTKFGWLFKTTNGGQSWVPTTGDPSGSNWKLDVRLFSPQVYVVLCGNGNIIRTTNGGLNWTITILSASMSSMHFSDSLHGFIVGQNGQIAKTNDGGQTWAEQTSGTRQILNSVYFDNNQNGWIASDIGNILSTNNGGELWSSLSNLTSWHIRSVQFFNHRVGCAIAGDNETILRTENGGADWKIVHSSNITNTLRDIYFPKGRNGWAVGSGRILHSSNSGLTWTPQTNTTPQPASGVFALDSQKVWGISSGKVFKSLDGGTTWTVYPIGSNVYPLSIHFSDENQGWVTGMNGIILHTTDGGITWQQQASGLTTKLNSIYFWDSQNGWAVGDAGNIVYTANGGNNWIIQTSGTSSNLTRVKFFDGLKGWAVGANGTILSTSNGGVNWTNLQSGTYVKLNGLSFQDPERGWVVGDYGVILSTGSNSEPPPVSTESIISGKTFDKTGLTCDTTDTPVPNTLIKALPGPYYARSNQEGRFELKLPLEETAVTYSIKAINNFGPGLVFNTVCPPSGQLSVAIDTLADTLNGNNLGFHISPCHYLDVDLASSFRRRCFKSLTSVAYVNRGSHEATDSYILVEFPEWVKPLSASVPYTALDNHTWRFNIGTLLPGRGGRFTVVDSVLCGNPQIFGLTQCTKATIYPVSDCPPPAGWNGADLSVSGQCQNGVVRLVIRNQGQGDMTDSTSYSLLMDSLLVKSGKVKLDDGDSLVFLVNAGGMTVTLSVNQPQNHPFELFASTSVENCGGIPGNPSQILVNHFPRSQSPRSKIQCLRIWGSFDPNDKQATPIGFTSNHVVKPGTEVEYMVRFQNTGTDTAFTVYVIDSLDNNLDVESLKTGASSHPYELSLQTTRHGRSFLRFQFNNILLPDSNTNELESHGFFQYRISPKTGLALGEHARNEAAIYFDFNEPVMTNQTLTTFDNLVFTNPGLSDSVHIMLPVATKPLMKQIGPDVFPNPFSSLVQLTSTYENPVDVSVFDLFGKFLVSKQFSTSGTISLGHLPAGVYLLKFPQYNRCIKVVKQ